MMCNNKNKNCYTYCLLQNKFDEINIFQFSKYFECDHIFRNSLSF